MFDLTAQVAVRCIAKVADAYKGDRESQHTYRRFCARVIGQYQKRLPAFCNGAIDLMVVRRKWYIACVCDIDDPALIKTTDVLGVDFGIVNIATDGDGKSYTGEAIEKVRAHLLRQGAGLQRRATKAAKRRLRKLFSTTTEVSNPLQPRDFEGPR